LIFIETALKGAFVIEMQKLEDERGFFARAFCEREFAAHGMTSTIAQCNVSYNLRKGTLRGMHYQAAPFEETKVVRCTQGAIFDVIIDLRPESPTYKNWICVDLSAQNCRMLYVPANFAHGFETLDDKTEVFYQMSQFYSSEHSRGLRWNDPAFEIRWPIEPQVVHERDRNYPDFQPVEHSRVHRF
jgi:dTDP-4-dehydrorhamnose 3,5-epimerase